MHADTAALALMSEEPTMSRSAGMTLPGKCTERMSADMPDSLYEAATRRRLQLGFSEAEYLRFLVMRDSLGEDAVRRMHEERMALLLGSGPDSVPAGLTAR